MDSKKFGWTDHEEDEMRDQLDRQEWLSTQESILRGLVLLLVVAWAALLTWAAMEAVK